MLAGLNPFSPRPGTFRELVFAAGASGGQASERTILLYGNRTTAGSETVSVIGDPVVDDADMVARTGRRSELYWMYKVAVAVDPGAKYYFVCVPESGGTAATVDFVIANTATGAATIEISFLGEKTYASVSSGDTITVIGEAIEAAINAASDGSWPCTANNVAGTVTVTMSLKGPRFGLALGSTANLGMRIRLLSSVTTTITKGNFVAGTTEDDGSNAILEAAQGSYGFHCSPWHTTSAPTETDNQLGELSTMIRSQSLPINGKQQVFTSGFVGASGSIATVSAAAAINTAYGYFFWQENSDWLPGMLAAHHAAVMRSQQIADPGYNFDGYMSGDNTLYKVPPHYLKADRPTTTEIEGALNNGMTPIGATANGSPYIARLITSRSLNAQGNNDYRARDGHITPCTFTFWEVLQGRWESTKQPRKGPDPVRGEKPLPKTTTPGQVKELVYSTIDAMVAPNPLGVYPAPILDAGQVASMKNSVVITDTPGGYGVYVDVQAVKLLHKGLFRIAEVSPAV